MAKVLSITNANAASVKDPTLESIGDPSNLDNYLPDSGASDHMTPCRDDLYDVEEGQQLAIEVADGHVIRCTKTGKVDINLLDDNGNELNVVLQDCMYVPGLSRRLFSITKFASFGHSAIIKKNEIILYFGDDESPISLPIAHGDNLASNIEAVLATDDNENSTTSISAPVQAPARQTEVTHAKKRISLELLHNHLAHRKCRALLAASQNNVWFNAVIRMVPEKECESCKISTTRATARNKEPHAACASPGQIVYMDILCSQSPVGLTPATTHANYLLLVEAYSRFTYIYNAKYKLPRGNRHFLKLCCRSSLCQGSGISLHWHR
jgi:hypothetical protein